MTDRPPRIGIFGAGKSGGAIARRALAAGYEVRIATAGTPETVALITGIVMPGAVATSAEDVVLHSDIVIIAVPLRRFHALPLHLITDQVVVDVMNHWPPVDGELPEFATGLPSSVVLRNALPASASVVKTLNHIGYHEMEDLALPSGTPSRVALGIAGDDPDALDEVIDLIDRIGFEPVLVGPLADSGVLEPGSPVFGAHVNVPAFRSLLHGAPVPA